MLLLVVVAINCPSIDDKLSILESSVGWLASSREHVYVTENSSGNPVEHTDAPYIHFNSVGGPARDPAD